MLIMKKKLHQFQVKVQHKIWMVPQKQQQLNILLGLQDRNKVFLKHYNGSNGFLLVNITKLYHFKAKYSEIKPYPLCFGNIAKDFAVNNMNKTELNVHV